MGTYKKITRERGEKVDVVSLKIAGKRKSHEENDMEVDPEEEGGDVRSVGVANKKTKLDGLPDQPGKAR